MGCAHSAPAQQPAPLQSKSIARKRAEAKHLQHLVNTTHCAICKVCGSQQGRQCDLADWRHAAVTTDEIRALDSHFQKLSNSLHHVCSWPTTHCYMTFSSLTTPTTHCNG